MALFNKIIEYFKKYVLIDILKDTIRFFFQNFWPICMIFLPFALPVAYLRSQAAMKIGTEGSSLLNFALPAFVECIFNPMYTGAHIILFTKILNSDRWTFKECVTSGFIFWQRLFTMYIVSGFLILTGLIAFVFPGLLMIALFSFSEFLIVLEGQTPINSLKNSAMLTKKYVPSIIGTYLSLLLPFMIITLLLEGPLAGYINKNFMVVFVFEMLKEMINPLILILYFRFYSLHKFEEGK